MNSFTTIYRLKVETHCSLHVCADNCALYFQVEHFVFHPELFACGKEVMWLARFKAFSIFKILKMNSFFWIGVSWIGSLFRVSNFVCGPDIHSEAATTFQDGDIKNRRRQGLQVSGLPKHRGQNAISDFDHTHGQFSQRSSLSIIPNVL